MMTKAEQQGGPPEQAPPGVEFDQPERMCLLGLLMKGVLEGNLAQPDKAHGARKLRGDVFVQAGRMEVTLRFREGGVLIRNEASRAPRARVRGSMQALLGMVTGGGLVWPVLSGQVRVRSNPFFLLAILPLIRVGEAGSSKHSEGEMS